MKILAGWYLRSSEPDREYEWDGEWWTGASTAGRVAAADLTTPPADWYFDADDAQAPASYWDGTAFTNQEERSAAPRSSPTDGADIWHPSTARERIRESGLLWIGLVTLIIIGLVSVGVISGTSGNSGSASPNDPDSARPTLSSCERSLAAAAQVPVDQDANSELVRTASDCRSVTEWVEAARKFPEAMGQTSAANIDPVYDLAGICGLARTAPVCQDAIARNLDTYW